MLVTLAATVYDLLGYVQLNVLSERRFQAVERRVSRTRTMDGGAVINDGGYSDADRTINVEWQSVDEAHRTSVERLLRLHSLVVVSTLDGVFLAAPEKFTAGSQTSRMSLLVKRKLST